MKLKKLWDIWCNFRRNNAKTGKPEKITKVLRSNAQFFYYSSSYVNCHGIQATIKLYANNIERS